MAMPGLGWRMGLGALVALGMGCGRPPPAPLVPFDPPPAGAVGTDDDPARRALAQVLSECRAVERAEDVTIAAERRRQRALAVAAYLAWALVNVLMAARPAEERDGAPIATPELGGRPCAEGEEDLARCGPPAPRFDPLNGLAPSAREDSLLERRRTRVEAGEDALARVDALLTERGSGDWDAEAWRRFDALLDQLRRACAGAPSLETPPPPGAPE